MTAPPAPTAPVFILWPPHVDLIFLDSDYDPPYEISVALPELLTFERNNKDFFIGIDLANRYILGAVYENNLSCLYQEYAFTELKIEYLVFLWHFFVNRRKSEPHRLENLTGMNSPCNSAGSYFAWLFHETIFKNSITLKWRTSGPKRVFKKFQSIGTDDKCVQSSELNNCILV